MNETLLERIARDAMVAHGLEPDFSPAARAQIGGLREPSTNGCRDLRDAALVLHRQRRIARSRSARSVRRGQRPHARADRDCRRRRPRVGGIAAGPACRPQHDVGLHAGDHLSDAAAASCPPIARRSTRTRIGSRSSSTCWSTTTARSRESDIYRALVRNKAQARLQRAGGVARWPRPRAGGVDGSPGLERRSASRIGSHPAARLPRGRRARWSSRARSSGRSSKARASRTCAPRRPTAPSR